MIPQIAEFFRHPLLLDAGYAARLASVAKAGSALTLEKRSTTDLRLAAETQAKNAKQSASTITAVLPVHGLIDHRDSWMLQMFGGTAVDSLREGIELCMNEPRIGGIVFDFDTPGGSAFGVKELADYVYACRAEMPMVAVSNSMMASAGYYLAAPCSRIYASDSSQTGSVGVYMEHYDESQALADAGIKPTIVRVPEYKAEGHPAEPLTDAAKQTMEARCQQMYDQFTADVARYRGITQKQVQDAYGQGRTLDAKSALAAGMVDRIGTFQDVTSEMKSGKMARSLAQSGRMCDATVARMRAELLLGKL